MTRCTRRRQRRSPAELASDLAAKNRLRLDARCNAHVPSKELVRAVREVRREITNWARLGLLDILEKGEEIPVDSAVLGMCRQGGR